MNERGKQILCFIENYIDLNGYPPTVREIGKGIGLRSTATVHGYLNGLEQKVIKGHDVT